MLHQLGWREYAVLDGEAARKVDPELAPPQAYLGVLGMPGLTAYVGLLDIAALREGDVVFVSGAAGAVGSLAGQIAKLRGPAVIGSAGSPEKVALPHRRARLRRRLQLPRRRGRRASSRRPRPRASTSTSTTSAASTSRRRSTCCNRNGRVAMCGAISQYNATEPPPGPRNLGTPSASA